MTDELIERLQHATTVSYREGDAESTERALDEVCDRVGILIGELRATAECAASTVDGSGDANV